MVQQGISPDAERSQGCHDVALETLALNSGGGFSLFSYRASVFALEPDQSSSTERGMPDLEKTIQWRNREVKCDFMHSILS